MSPVSSGVYEVAQGKTSTSWLTKATKFLLQHVVVHESWWHEHIVRHGQHIFQRGKQTVRCIWITEPRLVRQRAVSALAESPEQSSNVRQTVALLSLLLLCWRGHHNGFARPQPRAHIRSHFARRARSHFSKQVRSTSTVCTCWR